ncbi:hypothetical protein N7486_010821 [Penicillium sp. IBT 16267x]|nr:hypothetical protein N7486_010821 [Penicillium sp. IBT 16267x]
MPVEYAYPSDDSDFSETDMSIRGRHGGTHIRRRSVSRHAHQRVPEVREYLAPAPTTRVYRSASTGGRRPRDRDSSVPAVMIVNEQATRTDSRTEARNANSNKPRHRVQQKQQLFESDEELDLEPARRSSRRRHRERESGAISAHVNVTAEAPQVPGRTPSPFHRDYELAMNQRLLERSDMQQNMEIWKQQQEIERLERQLDKHREKPAPPRDSREHRLLREEEEWYEDEISERLRRLERYERKQKEEETARKAEKEWRLRKLEDNEKDEESVRKAEKAWRMRKLEEAEKDAAEKEEIRERLKKEKLEEIARHQEEEAEKERIKKEIIEEERLRAFEAEEKRKKELMLKAAAVEEWKLEQERIKQKAAEEAAKRDQEFRERLRLDLGYDEEEIAHILSKRKRDHEKKEKEEKEEKEKEKEKKEKEEKEKKEKELIEERKTTWIKVHRKHLLPETLLAYNLPWDWDETDSNYIIIKRWVTEDFQEELFSHTKRIREGKVLTQTSQSQTELKVNDRHKDRMYLVRKKSPQHRLRIFAS